MEHNIAALTKTGQGVTVIDGTGPGHDLGSMQEMVGHSVTSDVSITIMLTLAFVRTGQLYSSPHLKYAITSFL